MDERENRIKKQQENINGLLKLIQENPDLPIIPMVDSEIVADDSCCYWRGQWGRADILHYYMGEKYIHFKEWEDEEDVLADIAGCKYYCDPDGNDITELADEEWDRLYNSIPWTKAIVVHIDA